MAEIHVSRNELAELIESLEVDDENYPLGILLNSFPLADLILSRCTVTWKDEQPLPERGSLEELFPGTQAALADLTIRRAKP